MTCYNIKQVYCICQMLKVILGTTERLHLQVNMIMRFCVKTIKTQIINEGSLKTETNIIQSFFYIFLSYCPFVHLWH